MPQLNPSPWLSIMLISWLTLTFILQPKLLFFTTMNQPTDKTLSCTKPLPWNWPWT
uniref:ATP synthase complex subunit 8 n=1 Tax=Cephalopterus ornatus TaxID=114276 RepID=A0A7M3U7M6_CEPOR|nr:ATP synthase F0 subunit 8 [Cephalopterus ornatus]QOD95683.1 ATP synthase F0 subunit 8 [Cephalopterus ornatus]